MVDACLRCVVSPRVRARPNSDTTCGKPFISPNFECDEFLTNVKPVDRVLSVQCLIKHSLASFAVLEGKLKSLHFGISSCEMWPADRLNT